MDFDMIENAQKEYVGKSYIWHAREIVVINCFSCYDGDFFEYYFTDDADGHINRISMFDPGFMKVLAREK